MTLRRNTSIAAFAFLALACAMLSSSTPWAAEPALTKRQPVRLDNRKLVGVLGAEPHTPLDVAIERTLEGLGCLPASLPTAAPSRTSGTLPPAPADWDRVPGSSR